MSGLGLEVNVSVEAETFLTTPKSAGYSYFYDQSDFIFVILVESDANSIVSLIQSTDDTTS